MPAATAEPDGLLTALTLNHTDQRITPEWVDTLLPLLPVSLRELKLVQQPSGQSEPLLYTFTLQQLTNLTSLELNMEGKPDSMQLTASSQLPCSIQALNITAPLPRADHTTAQLVLQLTALRKLQLYLDYTLPIGSLHDMSRQLMMLTHVELGVKRLLPGDYGPEILASLRQLPLRSLHVLRAGERLVEGVGQLVHLTELELMALTSLIFRDAAASLQQLTNL